MMAVEILDDQVHQLIQNNGWKNNASKVQDMHCLLCKLCRQQSKSIYGCMQYTNGFHVNCFTAYHFSGVLAGNAKVLIDMILGMQNEKRTRQYTARRSEYVGSIADLKLLYFMECCTPQMYKSHKTPLYVDIGGGGTALWASPC